MSSGKDSDLWPTDIIGADKNTYTNHSSSTKGSTKTQEKMEIASW